MVIYTKETKTLIIPEGLGNLQSGNCDGVYREGFDDGYAQALEDCSGATCELQAGTLNLQNGDQGRWDIYPEEGYEGFEQVIITDQGYGEGKYNQGYQDGLANCPECPTVDCTSAVTEAYQEGYDAGVAYCSGATPCELGEGEYELAQYWDGEPITVTPSSGDGFSSIVITDGGYGDQQFYNGYFTAEEEITANIRQQAQVLSVSANGSYSANTGANIFFKEVNVNVPQPSGGSCTLEEGLFMLTPDFSGTTIYPTTADGFSSVDIYDSAEGYWKKWYDEGYNDGLAECQECDCSSAITEAFGEGYQSGATDTFPIAYQSGATDTWPIAYQSGYTDAQADCSGSTCNLQSGTLVLDENFSGFDTVYPDSGYDGFESVEIQDGGYGDTKYNEGLNDGFNSGYQSAVTDTFPIAYQSGYTDGRAATGTDRTYAIEVTFATENSYFASVSGAHIDVTTLVHPNDHLYGTAKPSFFDYTYFNEDYDYQNNIATYQFVGQWRYGSPSGQVQGNVTPVDLFMWISKANIQNWGDFHCTKVRFNPNVTIENGVAVFEEETGFEYIPVWTDDDGVPTATDNRFLDIQIEWNQDLYCASAVTEAFEEGQGTVGTIEFTFEGDLPTVGWDTNPVITAEMYSGNTYVGQYNFDYSMDGYDITSESLSQGTKAVKSFVGTFKKQGGLPRSSKYMDIHYIGIDVPSAYLADWSNWTLTIRVNGRPQYIYCPGPVICGLNKIRPGGFKLRTLSIDTTQPGYTPNTTHVIANL